MMSSSKKKNTPKLELEKKLSLIKTSPLPSSHLPQGEIDPFQDESLSFSSQQKEVQFFPPEDLWWKKYVIDKPSKGGRRTSKFHDVKRANRRTDIALGDTVLFSLCRDNFYRSPGDFVGKAFRISHEKQNSVLKIDVVILGATLLHHWQPAVDHRLLTQPLSRGDVVTLDLTMATSVSLSPPSPWVPPRRYFFFPPSTPFHQERLDYEAMTVDQLLERERESLERLEKAESDLRCASCGNLLARFPELCTPTGLILIRSQSPPFAPRSRHLLRRRAIHPSFKFTSPAHPPSQISLLFRQPFGNSHLYILSEEAGQVSPTEETPPAFSDFIPSAFTAVADQSVAGFHLASDYPLSEYQFATWACAFKLDWDRPRMPVEQFLALENEALASTHFSAVRRQLVGFLRRHRDRIRPHHPARTLKKFSLALDGLIFPICPDFPRALEHLPRQKILRVLHAAYTEHYLSSPI